MAYSYDSPEYTAAKQAARKMEAYAGDSIQKRMENNQDAINQRTNALTSSADKAYQKIGESYNTNITDYYKQAEDTIQRQTQDSLDELPQKYQSAYDANAVQQAINQRQVAERMSNLGLTNSGANRSQQTAVSLMRANADSAVRMQQLAAQNQLERDRNDKVAQLNLEKTARLADINHQLDLKLQDYKNSVAMNGENNLYSMALAQYNADRSDWLAYQQYLNEKQMMDEQRAYAVEDRDRNFAFNKFLQELNQISQKEIAADSNKTQIEAAKIQAG